MREANPEDSDLLGPAMVVRFEGYFVELLDKLERIATVMERFDNVMNPTLEMAEDSLEEERGRLPEPMFPSIFGGPIAQAG